MVVPRRVFSFTIVSVPDCCSVRGSRYSPKRDVLIGTRLEFPFRFLEPAVLHYGIDRRDDFANLDSGKTSLIFSGQCSRASNLKTHVPHPVRLCHYTFRANLSPFIL
jgi:hypothetical protein